MIEEFEISTHNKKEIDRWMTKYPPNQKRSAVVTALLLVQEQNGGWLSTAAMNAVASYLEMSPADVYEVATFYDLYETKPVGKHRISLCTNISCMLMGADKIAEHLKERLGVNLGETTPDGKFTLRATECLAACGGAPVCQINYKQYHENLTTEKMSKLIDQLEKEVG